MTNDELLANLRRALTRCAGFENDELATDREHALDYYHMRPNGTEVVGRSTYVAGDISAAVESNLAAMLEAYSSKRIIEFDPLDAADENQAQLESDAVVHFVMGENNGRWQFAQAIKETLQLRNGWIKVWCEEEREAKIEERRGVTPEALLEFTERPGVECKILSYDPDREGGYLKTRCVYVTKRFRAEAVPAENIMYPKQYSGCDFRALQAIPVLFERRIDTRSDLIKKGFNQAKVEKLKEYKNDGNTTAAARNPRKDNSLTPGVDASSELVEWYEAHALVDGGDGVAERQKICVDAKMTEILLRETSRLVGYATGQVFIAPHRLTGISLYDKGRQGQDMNTALGRALADNVQATSKNRLVYLDGKVNPDDVGDGRVNGAIRVKSSVTDVRQAAMPLVIPDTSQGIKEAIQHQRQIRTELLGSSLDMQAGELQVSKQVGSIGLDRAFSVAEQLAAHMTQNVADTLIRSTFLLAHAVLREHFDEQLPVKINGRWETVKPSEWRKRESLTVKVGMSPGERARQAATLDKMLQTQIQLDQLGMDGILVNLEGFYSLLMDWARMSGVAHPERYYVDPRSDASLKEQDGKRKSQQAQQKQQAQLVTQAVELEKLRTALEKYKADTDNAIEIWAKKVDAKLEYAKLGQQAEIEEARLVAPAATELLRARNERKATGRETPEGEPAARADAA